MSQKTIEQARHKWNLKTYLYPNKNIFSRKYATCTNGPNIQQARTATFEATQGTILGPDLYTAYINSMLALNRVSKIILYSLPT